MTLRDATSGTVAGRDSGRAVTVHDDDEPMAGGGFRPRLVAAGRRFAPALGVYAASRLAVLGALALASFVGQRPLADVVDAWDGQHYVSIARDGYPTSVGEGDFYEGTGGLAQSVVAFFPLQSLLARAVAWSLPLSTGYATVAVSLLAGAVAAVLVWLLAERLFDRETAHAAAALLCFFPGAFVLSLPYAEALLVALAAGCLLALHHERWLLAGALAALATATRPNGVALVAACAWAAAVAVHRRREWRSLVAPLLAPAGIAAYFLYLWRHTGEAFVWFRTQRDGWGERLDFGRNTARVAWRFMRDPVSDPNTLIIGLSLLFTVAALVLLVRARLPGAVNAYVGVVLLLAVWSQTLGARPRFVFAAFPLLLPLAHLLRGPWLLGTVGAFGGGMTVLAVLYGLELGLLFP